MKHRSKIVALLAIGLAILFIANHWLLKPITPRQVQASVIDLSVANLESIGDPDFYSSIPSQWVADQIELALLSEVDFLEGAKIHLGANTLILSSRFDFTSQENIDLDGSLKAGISVAVSHSGLTWLPIIYDFQVDGIEPDKPALNVARLGLEAITKFRQEINGAIVRILAREGKLVLPFPMLSVPTIHLNYGLKDSNLVNLVDIGTAKANQKRAFAPLFTVPEAAVLVGDKSIEALGTLSYHGNFPRCEDLFSEEELVKIQRFRSFIFSNNTKVETTSGLIDEKTEKISLLIGAGDSTASDLSILWYKNGRPLEDTASRSNAKSDGGISSEVAVRHEEHLGPARGSSAGLAGGIYRPTPSVMRLRLKPHIATVVPTLAPFPDFFEAPSKRPFRGPYSRARPASWARSWALALAVAPARPRNFPGHGPHLGPMGGRCRGQPPRRPHIGPKSTLPGRYASRAAASFNIRLSAIRAKPARKPLD